MAGVGGFSLMMWEVMGSMLCLGKVVLTFASSSSSTDDAQWNALVPDQCSYDGIHKDIWQRAVSVTQ